MFFNPVEFTFCSKVNESIKDHIKDWFKSEMDRGNIKETALMLLQNIIDVDSFVCYAQKYDKVKKAFFFFSPDNSFYLAHYIEPKCNTFFRGTLSFTQDTNSYFGTGQEGDWHGYWFVTSDKALWCNVPDINITISDIKENNCQLTADFLKGGSFSIINNVANFNFGRGDETAQVLYMKTKNGKISLIVGENFIIN